MAMRERSQVTRPRAPWTRAVHGVAVSTLAAAMLAVAPCSRQAEAAREESASRDWNDLLRRHVRGDRVDYDGFERDRAILTRYLQSLSETPPASLARNDEIALWINAYNAATVDLIVRERIARSGRLRSIREIPAPWTRPRWRILGTSRTLDEIEHEILRKRFREPRVHFALVCASRSCPALRPSAYAGPFLGAQLDSAARAFILDPARNRFAPEEGRVRISKIFDWYGRDFASVARDDALFRLYGSERGAMLAFASRFLSTPDVAKLRSSKHRLEFLPYDWSLNSTGNAR
jgi:hypothetical protein